MLFYKKLLIIVLAFSCTACSKSDVTEALPSIPADTGNSNSGTDTGDLEIPDKAAIGKINGKEFQVMMGAIFVDPFDPGKAEILLSEENILNCWNFYDRSIILPIEDKNNIFGTHTVLSGSNQFAHFYDSANGKNVNASVNKESGMKWTLEIDDEIGEIVGGVMIPAKDGSDKNFVEGIFPVINCL